MILPDRKVKKYYFIDSKISSIKANTPVSV